MKTKANTQDKRRNRSRSMILPGAEEWERWEQSGDAPWKRTATAGAPSALGLSKTWLFGVPAADLATLPLTITAPDFVALQGALALQMERRGLIDEQTPSTVVEVSVDGDRRSGLGIALSHDTLAPKDAVAAEHCSVSARTRNLPPWSLVFWNELGKTSMGVTRSDGLIYFHTLGNGTPSALLLRARCQVLWLMELGWLKDVRQLAIMEGTPSFEALAQALSLPYIEAALPAPAQAALPTRWEVVPAAVQDRGKAIERGARMRTALLGVAALVVLCAGALAADIIRLRIQLAQERAWIEKHEPEVRQIRNAAAQWDALATAISPDAFPLELLQRTASLLPAEGARFTSFDWSNGQLIIRGESVNPELAYRYLTALKQNPQTQGTQWEMPGPSIQPNDLSAFNIQGTTPYAQVIAE